MSIVRGTSSSGGATSGTSLVLTKPASLADGDVLVAAINVRLNTTTITAPAGWTTVAQATHGSASACTALFYRYVATASGEGANYTFSWTGGAANSGAIVRYSGVDVSTQSDVAASTNTSGASGTTGTWLGITTATASAMLIGAMSAPTGATTFSAETSPLTEVFDFGANETAVLCDGEQVSAGASGNKTATLSSSRDWVAILWALRPATGGGITGTGATTIGPPALSASGTYTPQAITGTGALSVTAPALAASGSYTPQAIAGTGNVTIGPPILAGTGTYTPAAITGTGALSIGAPVLAGAGAFTPVGGVGGDGAVTIGHPTFSGSGTSTPPTWTGTGALAIGHPALAGAGTFALPGVTGTGAVTIGHPTLNGSQVVVLPAIRASATDAAYGLALAADAAYTSVTASDSEG